MKQKIEAFGRKLADARGSRGVRAVAKQIGISAATLSRVERGYMPDLETFGKICSWLKLDPAEVLGIDVTMQRPSVSVHFKKDATIHPDTAKALAELILAAQRAAVVAEQEKIGSGV